MYTAENRYKVHSTLSTKKHRLSIFIITNIHRIISYTIYDHYMTGQAVFRLGLLIQQLPSTLIACLCTFTPSVPRSTSCFSVEIMAMPYYNFFSHALAYH